MVLLQELQDANMKLAAVRAKLQSTSEKLQYATIVRSQFVQGGSQPQIVVIRMDGKSQTRILANEEYELQPGDVVEVTLRPGQPSDQREQ
jgi:polysaccharide export outer membrane protein